MATIYRKTDQGQAEIQHRLLRLSARLRNLLIMTDGKRDAQELQRLIGDETEALLAQLLSLGLIDAVGFSRPKDAKDAPNSQLGPRSKPMALGAAAGNDAARFEQLRKQAVRELNDALGPEAQSLAIRMERTQSADQLYPLLAQAAQLIADIQGDDAGEIYARRFADRI